jgi:hypothetical protein
VAIFSSTHRKDRCVVEIPPISHVLPISNRQHFSIITSSSTQQLTAGRRYHDPSRVQTYNTAFALRCVIVTLNLPSAWFRRVSSKLLGAQRMALSFDVLRMLSRTGTRWGGIAPSVGSILPALTARFRGLPLQLYYTEIVLWIRKGRCNSKWCFQSTCAACSRGKIFPDINVDLSLNDGERRYITSWWTNHRTTNRCIQRVSSAS